MSGKLIIDFHLPKDLYDLKENQGNELLVKSLVGLAGIVAGIAMTAFLSLFFAKIGIALILISSIALYRYYNDYRTKKNIYLNAAAAIYKNFTLTSFTKQIRPA